MTKPKQILRKSTSVFLAALFFFLMIPLSGILNLTVHAASKGEYDVKVRWRASWTKGFSVRNPHDNKTYSVSGHGTIIYIDGVTAYCLQLGAPAASNPSAILQVAGISEPSYFEKNLPKDTQKQVALILGLSQDLGTSGHEKYVYDYAKQVLIWESTLGFRNYKSFEYNKDTDKILFNNIGNGSGAADGVDLTAKEIRAAYVEIENRVKEYLKIPTNTVDKPENTKVAAQMVPTKVPAPTPDKPDATKIEKWTADIKDPTWKYTDIALFNSSPTAQKYKIVMSLLPDNTGVHIEMPHPTNPDGTPLDEAGWNPIKAEIEAAVFQADKTQNQQLKAITGGDFYCYATEDPKDQKMIAGTPKVDPISLFFKVSFDQLPPETPDPDPPPPDPPKPPKIDVPGQKYGEYDDAGGLGGATIVLYQTAGYEKVETPPGEPKPEVPEYELVQYDTPKKIATTKSKDDGSFVFRNLSGGEYYAQELDHATGGGYTLEGSKKPVNNYLNPTVFSDEGEICYFNIEMTTDPEADSPYTLTADTEYIELYNYQQHGMISIQKLDKETGDQPQGDGTLQGAKFSIIEVEGYEADGTPYGMVVQNLVTNEQGKATSSELQEGVKYCITETNAPIGYLLYTNGDKGAWYQEFMIEFDGDHDNEITYEYTRLEHGVAGGKNDTPMQCANQIKKGRFKIYKFLEKLPDGNPGENDNQQKIPGAGLTFDIYLASKTPKSDTPDAEYVENRYIFRQKANGEIMTVEEMANTPELAQGWVSSVVTDSNGEAITELLPYGKYVVVERQPLAGYDLPHAIEQWVDSQVYWNPITKDFVGTVGGDGMGNDGGLGIEYNPPSSTPTISQANLVKNKVMNALGTNKVYDEAYRGWITEEHYQSLLTYYDTFVNTPHYVDKDGNLYDEWGDPITPENGTLMTKDAAINMAMDLCSNMYDQYVAIDYDPDQVVEIGGDVYQEHKDEYEAAHGKPLEKVDEITYPLYIQNQTTKRYIQIVKKDAVSDKLIPLNDFYFKVWDCTRERWVEDNRNSATLGPVDVWQTNAKGEAVGVNGEDLAGKANLVDFLEFGEKGYDIYEIHTHSGYYLSETPVHFDFNYDSYKPGEPVIVEFHNNPVLGNATLQKAGEGPTSIVENEDGTTSIQFSDVNLKGAIFGVYVDDNQPVRAKDEDGTIRENRNPKRNYSYAVDTEYAETTRTLTFTASDTLNAGALVETIMTDENGIIKTSNLYEGKYYFKELYSPVGYELEESQIPFEIRDTHNKPFEPEDENLNPRSPTATNPDPAITTPNLDYQPEKDRLGAVEPAQNPTLEPLEMVFVSAYNKRQQLDLDIIKRFVMPVDGATLDWTGTKVAVYANEDIKNPNYVPPEPEPPTDGQFDKTLPEDNTSGQPDKTSPEDSASGQSDKISPEDSTSGQSDKPLPEEESPPQQPEPEPEFLYRKDQLIQEFEIADPHGYVLKTQELPFGKYYAKITKLPATVICRTEKFEFPIFLPPESQSSEAPEKPDVLEESAPTTGTFDIDLTKYFVWAWDAEHEKDHIAETPSGMFQDITFGLYNRKEIKNAATGAVLVPKDTLLNLFSFDENGKGITKVYDEQGNVVSYACNHLPIGDYYIKELTTYPGYILNLDEFDFRFYPNQEEDKKVHIIAVSASTEKKPILNRPDGTPELPDQPTPPEPEPPPEPEKPSKPKDPPPPKGNLELTKTDVSDGMLIPNCGVQILDENMQLVFQGYTGTEGKVVFTLSPGKYYYREFDAPAGYQIDDTPFPFEIRWDGDIVKATMTNEKATGQLELTKTDVSTGKTIPDCGVEILDETGKILFQGRTDENGVVVFPNLPTGKYYYREFDAPEGYLLDSTQFPFEIKETGEIVKAVMTNERKPSYLELTKTDVSTGKTIPDCGVEILDETGNVLFQGRTDGDGTVKFQLPIGKYFYREFDPPAGYLLDDTPFPFEIRENGEIVKAVMTNEPKVGQMIPSYTPDGGSDELTGKPPKPGDPSVPQTGENWLSTYVGIGVLSASTLSTIGLLIWFWRDRKTMKQQEEENEHET